MPPCCGPTWRATRWRLPRRATAGSPIESFRPITVPATFVVTGREAAAAAAVPRAVRAVAGAEPLEPVWRNALGGLTYRLGADRFVKWSPHRGGPDLGGEAQRMRWAVRWATVPLVVGAGGDREGSWLITEALPGDSAVSPRWLADPAAAVRGIGRALRQLHDRAPVDLCPFDWSARLRALRARHRGRHDPADWMPEHRAMPAADAFAALDTPPPIDRPVVCCGDPCAPNVLLRGDGEAVGLVDLGALGVADRWADLAVATWSADWNYGPGWDSPLLDSYGIDPDPERTAYYRLLWDLSP